MIVLFSAGARFEIAAQTIARSEYQTIPLTIGMLVLAPDRIDFIWNISERQDVLTAAKQICNCLLCVRYPGRPDKVFQLRKPVVLKTFSVRFSESLQSVPIDLTANIPLNAALLIIPELSERWKSETSFYTADTTSDKGKVRDVRVESNTKGMPAFVLRHVPADKAIREPEHLVLKCEDNLLKYVNGATIGEKIAGLKNDKMSLEANPKSTTKDFKDKIAKMNEQLDLLSSCQQLEGAPLRLKVVFVVDGQTVIVAESNDSTSDINTVRKINRE